MENDYNLQDFFKILLIWSIETYFLALVAIIPPIYHSLDGAPDDSINNYPARVREGDTSGNQAVVI